MGKFTVAGLAIALALILNLGTPRPASATGHCNRASSNYSANFTGGSGQELSNPLEDVHTNTPGCEVCLMATYRKCDEAEESNHYICTNDSFANLKDQPRSGKPPGMGNNTWNDYFNQVALYTDRCKSPAKAFVMLHKDEQMTGLSNNLTRESARSNGLLMRHRSMFLEKIPGYAVKLSEDMKGEVTSLYFSPDGNNPRIGRQLGGCRVCLYENPHYRGNVVCRNVGESASSLYENVKDNTVSSIDFQTDACPRGQALWAAFYERDNFGGDSLYMDETDSPSTGANLFDLARGERPVPTWNDAISSFKVLTSDAAALGCRACLYANVDYKGKKVCIAVNKNQPTLAMGKLEDYSFNNKAQSIKLNTKNCPTGTLMAVTVYDKDQGKGHGRQLEDSVRRLHEMKRPGRNSFAGGGNYWSIAISSMTVQLLTKAQQNCRVCLYEAQGYGGNKYCTGSGMKNLNDISFDDVTSSYKVFRKSCLGAGVTFFEDKNWGGDRLEYRLGRDNVEISHTNWNDRISGVLFNPTKHRVVDSSLPKPDGPNKWKVSGYEALDISAGPDGLVWIIGTDNNPKVWDGKKWSTRGSRKGKRIDAGSHGTAYMVGDDDYLYKWENDAWNREGIKKVTDVGVGPGGTIWIVGGDESDKRARSFGGNRNKPDHFKIYRWNGSRWFKGDQYAMRIDVDPRGHAWIVTRDKSGPYSYTRFVPRAPVSGTPPPQYGGRTQWDVSIGANGKVVLAADAPWVLNKTKRTWDVDHGRYFSALSVDRNGDLWGISTWDLQNNRPNTGLKKKILYYGNALKNVVAAAPAVAPKVLIGEKWQHIPGGKALDISVGPAGDAWAIGPGNLIYTWSGKGWTKREEKIGQSNRYSTAPLAKGTRIDVGPEGKAWMVGMDKFPYAFNGAYWEKKGNSEVSDVGVGADGTAWATGTNPNVPLQWTGSNWRRRTGVNDDVLRIDVGPKGEAWVVGKSGKVSARSSGGGSWGVKEFNAGYGKPPRLAPANDISIGADGKAIIVVRGAGIAIWKEEKKDQWGRVQESGEWERVNIGQLTQVNARLRPFKQAINVAAAADAKGAPWVTLADGDIWSIKDVYAATPPPQKKSPPPPATPPGQRWSAVSGNGLDISAGPDGDVWAIDRDGSPKFWSGTAWNKKTGRKGKRIDVGPQGWVWMVGTDDYPYSWTGTTWERQGNRKVKDVSIGAEGHVWAIGTDGSPYMREGTGWQKKAGVAGGARIDVDSRGNAWAVNTAGGVYYWTGTTWRNFQPIFPPVRPYGKPVLATDVSVGAKGGVKIAVSGLIGGGTVPTGIFSGSGQNWTPSSAPGPVAVGIAVDKNGNPWAIVPGNQIVAVKDASDVKPPRPAEAGQKWSAVNGAARDISAGPHGNVWVIGTDGSPFIRTATGWNRKTGKGTRIDVGPASVWLVGNDRYPYYWTGTGWNKVGNMQVIDVGVGAGNQVWVVGTDGSPYLREGTAWQKKGSGNVFRIDVDLRGNAWVISTQGMVLNWTGNTWRPHLSPKTAWGLPRAAIDISAGANGSVRIVESTGIVRGVDARIPGWTSLSTPRAYAASIAVDKNGNPWATTRKNEIHAVRDASRLRPPSPSAPEATADTAVARPRPAAPTARKTWQRTAGVALDISVGANGSVWAIDPDKSPKFWTGKKWTKITGKGTRIDVGNKGWAWLVGTNRLGYHWRNKKWNVLPGKKISDVAIGNNKAWAIGTDTKPGGHSVYRFTGQWTTRAGATGVRIDVDPKGNAWVVNDKGRVSYWTGKKWVKTADITKAVARSNPALRNLPPETATDISIGVKGQVWITLKGGGTAFWNGAFWTPGGLSAKSTSVAVNQNNYPLVTTDRQAIWAFK